MTILLTSCGWIRKRLLQIVAVALLPVVLVGAWPRSGIAFVATPTERIENSNDNRVRHRGRVAYDGAGFAGFQFQRNGARTIQV